jgi:hypothetical protein
MGRDFWFSNNENEFGTAGNSRNMKTERSKSRTTLASNILAFALHAAGAMIVSSVIAALLAGAWDSWTHGHGSFATASDFANPLIWGPGLVLGLFINRLTGQAAACWVWTAGLAWIAFGCWESVHFYRLQRQLFGQCSATDNLLNAFLFMDANRCGGASEILDGMFYTIPALSAVTYSVGARLGLWWRNRKSDNSAP